jgi:hypothetical protein
MDGNLEQLSREALMAEVKRLRRGWARHSAGLIRSADLQVRS